MTTAAALRAAATDIVAILDDAGLSDGDALSDKEIISTPQTTVLYHDTIAKEKKAAERQTFVVWTILSTNPRMTGDNDCSRQINAAIDLYTKRKTSTTYELIESLNDAAVDQGYTFEYDGPAEYNRDFEMYHISFLLTKNYY